MRQPHAKNKGDSLYKELTPHTKTDSKWFRDLNMQPKPIKVVEKRKISESLG